MKLAMHNWIHPEPIEATVERLARCGYDAIEISAEPALYDAGELTRRLKLHGLECWGGVTRMVGGRDLVHADGEVRRAGVAYVKDALRFVSDLNGDILTVTPSAVGKLEPMASPETEWAWCVEGLRECQEYATELGVRLAVEPLNRFETHFVNRCDQALALAEEVGGDCGICLDLFHMNIEEASWRGAIADAGTRIADVHVADSNRYPPGEGSFEWLDMLRALAAAGYDGYLTLEFVAPVDRTPLASSRERSFDDSVRGSAGFLRDRLAELAAEAPLGSTTS
ncbi:MAG: sugar phosphate isomerase/epimerase [Actinobacteria bacterium]|nr:sugar phosphate isomerase/epimerase [Actinomycetota bacterium]